MERSTNSTQNNGDIPKQNDCQRIMLARAANFRTRLLTALRDSTFLPQGGRLGFACLHLYEDYELPAPGLPLQAGTTIDSINLKGSDALVCVAAVDIGLSVTVLRLVTENCAGDRWSVRKIPDTSLVEKFGKKGTWGGVDGILVVEDSLVREHFGEGESLETVDWCVKLPGLPSFSLKNPEDTSLTPPMAFFAGDVVYSGTGYFGNEASPSDFYTHAGIVIHVPPYEVRENYLKLQSSVRAGIKRPATEISTEDEKSVCFLRHIFLFWKK